MNDTNLNSTSNMVSAAYNVMNIIENGGMQALREVDGWTPVNYSACKHDNGWASQVIPGATTAQCEVIIEHNGAGLSCIVRSYPDGSRRTTWAIASEMNVGIDRAMAHLTNHYLQAEPARQVETPAETTYEQWNEQRRALADSFDPSYDNIEFVHTEHETAMYFGKVAGQIVASWYCSTGTCKIQTAEKIADAIASDIRNYIINAHIDGAQS